MDDSETGVKFQHPVSSLNLGASRVLSCLGELPAQQGRNGVYRTVVLRDPAALAWCRHSGIHATFRPGSKKDPKPRAKKR
jgi:hypothetical protein